MTSASDLAKKTGECIQIEKLKPIESENILFAHLQLRANFSNRQNDFDAIVSKTIMEGKPNWEKLYASKDPILEAKNKKIDPKDLTEKFNAIVKLCTMLSPALEKPTIVAPAAVNPASAPIK